ncbi:hypothetical protein BIW11_11057 [Tropilaelaps mercedesae]|uniref:Uncharacterized protein n=1 Tax=Tropilaelaps mercedesae TaxID=418985 RepID=A0A1V9XDD2_9ACAR|nr:hypothetical protein BIW11_11057 [Tropilaelaps mercedesae]
MRSHPSKSVFNCTYIPAQPTTMQLSPRASSLSASSRLTGYFLLILVLSSGLFVPMAKCFSHKLAVLLGVGGLAAAGGYLHGKNSHHGHYHHHHGYHHHQPKHITNLHVRCSFASTHGRKQPQEFLPLCPKRAKETFEPQRQEGGNNGPFSVTNFTQLGGVVALFSGLSLHFVHFPNISVTEGQPGLYRCSNNGIDSSKVTGAGERGHPFWTGTLSDERRYIEADFCSIFAFVSFNLAGAMRPEIDK